MRSSEQEYAARSPQADSFVQPLSRKSAQPDPPTAKQVSIIPNWKTRTFSSPQESLRSFERGLVVVTITLDQSRYVGSFEPISRWTTRLKGSSSKRLRWCRISQGQIGGCEDRPLFHEAI